MSFYCLHVYLVSKIFKPCWIEIVLKYFKCWHTYTDFTECSLSFQPLAPGLCHGLVTVYIIIMESHIGCLLCATNYPKHIVHNISPNPHNHLQGKDSSYPYRWEKECSEAPAFRAVHF